MISKRLEDELNKQLNAEMYSAYLYLSMSAYLSKKTLMGSLIGCSYNLKKSKHML